MILLPFAFIAGVCWQSYYVCRAWQPTVFCVPCPLISHRIHSHRLEETSGDHRVHSLSLSFKHFSISLLYTLIKSPPSLLFSEMNNPSSLNLSPYDGSSQSLITLVALHWWHFRNFMSFLHWEAECNSLDMAS